MTKYDEREPVLLEKPSPHIWVIKINRPHARNAVNGPVAAALYDNFVAFDNDPEARVAVLYGVGGTFCAGADLKEVSKGNQSEKKLSLTPFNFGNGKQPSSAPAAARDAIHDGNGPMGYSRLLLKKPVIAAVSGHAVAGGLELACWCDLRVADPSAIFGVFCRRWGVPLIDGGTVRLANLVGQSRALDMVLTGRPVNAHEAERFGLVNRLAKGPDTVLREAIELANLIASFPQECMRADRLSLYNRSPVGEVPEWRRAMKGEFERGAYIVEKEAIAGAARFAAGVGRGGSFAAFGGSPVQSAKL